ncbi:hypothetical protein [Spiroplasma floricola]|uniref:Transmembrane protein n=1 Tax=Spiroplasma floricola 23-6 TaxID=1336749 RepID=A0A2K8SFC0_9MOLU|nr:hypothetical protein [Spiroplasma floricola]AUB32136.1 hypothetical protein SFLOR_v1c10900 [Spiroplasma floricola 23-6]
MFAIFIIFAWSLTLVSSIGLLLFGSMALMLLLSGSNPIALISNILQIITKPLFTPVYGSNGVIDSSTQGAGSNNQLATIIWMTISFFVAILLIVISIIELVRLRKQQKISKPYIKVTMVVLSIILLLTGQLLLVLISGLILIAFILLEAILFDSEALNNYAEERNLILIYKEEKKFEKEVSKQGKLVGNVDLKNLQGDFQKENEQVKTEDNSTLPFSTQNEFKVNSFSEDEKLNIIKKFNTNVTKVNSIAKMLKMPESYHVSYINVKNTENENDNLNSITQITNIVDTQQVVDISNEFNNLDDNDSQNLDDSLDSQVIILEAKDKEDNLEEDNLNSTQEVFVKQEDSEKESKTQEEDSLDFSDNNLVNLSQSNEIKEEESNKLLSSQEVVSTISKSENISLDENLLRQKLARAVNMDLNQLIESKEPDADKNLIYSDFNFNQPDLASQVLVRELKENNNEITNPISQIFSSKSTLLKKEDNFEEQKKVVKSNEPVFGRLDDQVTVKPIQQDSKNVKEKINLTIQTPSFVAKPTILSEQNFEFEVEKPVEENNSLHEFVEQNTVEEKFIAPVIESSNLNEIKSKVNSNELSQTIEKDNSVHNCNNDFQIEEIKKYIFEKEQELLNRFEADINSTDFSRLNTIEERILNLENLIESLGSKVFDNQVIQDFRQINKQLESISRVVNELENNTPKAIINRSITKHNYNRNNG